MRTPEPPPLSDDLETLLRRLRLPHIRRAAPEVIATARAQRWEPAEVLRALFTEELAGPRTFGSSDETKSRRVPDRQDLRGMGSEVVLDPGTYPVVAAHLGVGAPAGEPGGVRAVGTGRRSSWRLSARSLSRPP